MKHFVALCALITFALPAFAEENFPLMVSGELATTSVDNPAILIATGINRAGTVRIHYPSPGGRGVARVEEGTFHAIYVSSFGDIWMAGKAEVRELHLQFSPVTRSLRGIAANDILFMGDEETWLGVDVTPGIVGVWRSPWGEGLFFGGSPVVYNDWGRLPTNCQSLAPRRGGSFLCLEDRGETSRIWVFPADMRPGTRGDPFVLVEAPHIAAMATDEATGETYVALGGAMPEIRRLEVYLNQRFGRLGEVVAQGPDLEPAGPKSLAVHNRQMYLASRFPNQPLDSPDIGIVRVDLRSGNSTIWLFPPDVQSRGPVAIALWWPRPPRKG